MSEYNTYTLTREDVYSLNLENESVVRIPNGMVKIGKEVFKGNKAINTLILPDSIEVIGKNAFENCPNLTSVIITTKTNLRKIKKNAFANTGLITIALPSDIKISDSAFDGCPNFGSLFEFHRNYTDDYIPEYEEDEDIEDSEITDNEDYEEMLASAFEVVLGAIHQRISTLEAKAKETDAEYIISSTDIRIMSLGCIINTLRDEFAELGI